MFKLTVIVFSFLLFSYSALSGDHHASDSSAKHKNKSAHWGYHGAEGPEHWSDLSEEFAACESGTLQSPINLKWAKQKGTRTIEFDYNEVPLSVVDNGHTVQVNVPSGNFVSIDGKKYELLQFHFHSSSEHTFSGKYFPLEVHFVHKNTEGKLAVVGVMYQIGKENTLLGKIFKNIPHEKNMEKKTNVVYNPADLLPNVYTHYHYEGSLTTPPCSEGVNWNVLNTPKYISAEQLQHFTKIYNANNRPIQRLNGRRLANY